MKKEEIRDSIIARLSFASGIPSRMFFPTEDCGAEWSQHLERMHAEQLDILRRQKRQLMTAVLRMRRKKGVRGSLFMRSKA